MTETDLTNLTRNVTDAIRYYARCELGVLDVSCLKDLLRDFLAEREIKPDPDQ